MLAGLVEPTSGTMPLGCFISQASASTVRLTPCAFAICSRAATIGLMRYACCEGSSRLAPSPNCPPASGLQASGVIFSARHWSRVPSSKLLKLARLISTWLTVSRIGQAFCRAMTCEGRKLLTPNSRTLPVCFNREKAAATSSGCIR